MANLGRYERRNLLDNLNLLLISKLLLAYVQVVSIGVAAFWCHWCELFQSLLFPPAPRRFGMTHFFLPAWNAVVHKAVIHIGSVVIKCSRLGSSCHKFCMMVLNMPWCNNKSRQLCAMGCSEDVALMKHLGSRPMFMYSLPHLQSKLEPALNFSIVHNAQKCSAQRYLHRYEDIYATNITHWGKRQEMQETFWLGTKHMFTQLLFVLSVVLCLGLLSDKGVVVNFWQELFFSFNKREFS